MKKYPKHELYTVNEKARCLKCGHKGAVLLYGWYYSSGMGDETPTPKLKPDLFEEHRDNPYMSVAGGFGGTKPYRCTNCGNIGLVDFDGLEGFRKTFEIIEEEPKEAYMLTLVGSGIVCVKFVDSDVFHWICNGDYGKPVGVRGKEWADQTIPEHIKKEIWERKRRYNDGVIVPYDEFEIIVTEQTSSDRANYAPSVVINQEIGRFYHVSDALEFANKHGLKIEDEYIGYFDRIKKLE